MSNIPYWNNNNKFEQYKSIFTFASPIIGTLDFDLDFVQVIIKNISTVHNNRMKSYVIQILEFICNFCNKYAMYKFVVIFVCIEIIIRKYL